VAGGDARCETDKHFSSIKKQYTYILLVFYMNYILYYNIHAFCVPILFTENICSDEYTYTAILV